MEMTDGDGMNKHTSVWDAQADDVANNSNYQHAYNVEVETEEKDERTQNRTKREK